MDYKILFFLVVILLLILYLIKEIYFVKFDLLNYINTLKNNYEENNLILRKNFQNDLNVFANKIKLLNDENLQQFRKITLLNNQPIVKNNNYFKEVSESETADNGTELKYFSDSRMGSINRNTLSRTNNNDDEISRTSDLELTKNIISPQNKLREFITSSTSTSRTEKDDLKINNLEIEIKKGATIESSVVGFHVITDSDDSEQSDELELETLSDEEIENTENNKSNSKLISDESDEESLGMDETLDKSQNNNVIENKLNEEENENSIESENNEDLEDTEISFEKKELEPANNVIENKITKDNFIETVMDNITLGTKKSKNDKKQQINHLTEIKTSRELSKDINRENFKTIDDYTLEHLKNIAKKFNIPISAKISGKWKLLNKTEIYSEISKFLNKNI